MKYDYSKLNGRITEKYGSHRKFAEALRLSERSLSLKLKCERYFKPPEITKACALLSIDDCDIADYFFSQEVQCG